MHETEEMEMSSKPIGFIPKDRADDPPRGCWVTLIECVFVAMAIGLVLAGIFVWSCQEVELNYLRSASSRLDSSALQSNLIHQGYDGPPANLSVSQSSLKDGSQSWNFLQCGSNWQLARENDE